MIPTTTQLYIEEAEHKPLEYMVDVVMLLDTVDNKAIETVSGFLIQRIGSAGGGFATGILPCLGYQGDRFMFRLPQRGCPRTLHTTILEDVANDRLPSLGQRFDIMRQLAEALIILHSASLMHKNVRGDIFFPLQPRKGVTISPKAVDTPNVTNGTGESEHKDLEKKPEKAGEDEKGPERRRGRNDSPHRNEKKGDEFDESKIQKWGSGLRNLRYIVDTFD